jgi:hypothetical protein
MWTRSILAGRAIGSILTAAMVALTMTTTYIHLSLGGLLFTMNGLGYAALAAALVIGNAAPHPVVDRFSWLPRVGLAGYTAATIAGYLVMGPYFGLGWLTKGAELGILVLIALDVVRVYGSASGFVRSALVSLPRPRFLRPA